MFRIFVARSIQHILELRFPSSWYTNAILVLFKWVVIGQIFTEISHNFANYKVLYLQNLLAWLPVFRHRLQLWLLLFCRKTCIFFIVFSLFHYQNPDMLLTPVSKKYAWSYLEIFTNDSSSLPLNEKKLL